MNKEYDAFSKVIDAKDNSTGGGTASSIAGSMAAGLAGMVARLSMDKANLGPSEDFEEMASRAEELCRELFAGGSKDSEAFAVVSKAYGLPTGTAEEKAARSRAIKGGMILCAEVPLRNATLCSQVLSLCKKLEKSYNTNASSDLECAMHLATAGLKGCAANVRVNLPYIKDEAQVQDLESRLESILKDTI